jgi:hypothetical protein
MPERAPDITVEADGRAESTTILSSSEPDSGGRSLRLEVASLRPGCTTVQGSGFKLPVRPPGGHSRRPGGRRLQPQFEAGRQLAA